PPYHPKRTSSTCVTDREHPQDFLDLVFPSRRRVAPACGLTREIAAGFHNPTGGEDFSLNRRAVQGAWSATRREGRMRDAWAMGRPRTAVTNCPYQLHPLSGREGAIGAIKRVPGRRPADGGRFEGVGRHNASGGRTDRVRPSTPAASRAAGAGFRAHTW